MVMITNSFDKFPNEPTGSMYEQFGKTSNSPATRGEEGVDHSGDGGGSGAGGGGTAGGKSGNGGTNDNGGTGGFSGSNTAQGGTESNGSGVPPTATPAE